MHGWYSKERTDTGKRRVTFVSADALRDRHVSVPCGRCFGCQLERSRQWAVRCVQEASLWRSNCFVTLTYRTADLPTLSVPGGGFIPTLKPDDFVRFMKRLRLVKPGVRFLQAGEYGRLGRPHHHAVLFNCAFSDREFVAERPGGRMYRSAELEELWPYGFSSVADLSFDCAAYVARYTLKKMQLGGQQVGGRVPEYSTMSRRPGLGAGWFRRYRADVFPLDRMVVRVRPGRAPVVGKPPRYYVDLYRREDPAGFESVRARRRAVAETEAYGEANSDARGAVKEECSRRRVQDFLERRLP